MTVETPLESYEPGERVWVAVQFADYLPWHRASGQIEAKLNDGYYRISFLIPIMMREVLTWDFPPDLIAKQDNPEKWD